ncbi:unnamed protein product [Lactuca virosa]|uniref:Uncharacterized protein n=1 Tax=Lactuca virosa TaxID=75947 RepID=A0AAU9N6D8_9ASTR|nr:unnamed protein product [Lactuca virosa]
MLRASAPDNIRFIIIDIHDPTTTPEPPVPTTPALSRMTRMRKDNTSAEEDRTPQSIARALTFSPPGPPPAKNQKRSSK